MTFYFKIADYFAIRGIMDYVISQTTLEQIFNSFAALQDAEKQECAEGKEGNAQGSERWGEWATTLMARRGLRSCNLCMLLRL